MVEIPVAVPPPPSAPAPRARSRRILLGATALVAILGLAFGAVRLSVEAPREMAETSVEAEAPTQQAASIPAPPQEEASPSEAVSETAAAETLPIETPAIETPSAVDQDAAEAPRQTMHEAEQPSPSAQFAAVPEPAVAPAVTDEPPGQATASPPVAEAAPAGPVQTVPLPVARPPQFRSPVASDQPRRIRQPRAARVAAAAPPPVEDTRSFFDKFFGIQTPPAQTPAQTPALAYAALPTQPAKAVPPSVALAPVPAPAPVPPAGSGGIAVYDISARIVTLPNGERLEAHSGLGSLMDDARYVNLQARGPTPPGTYDLTEREAPFHGVRAIRLTPVGGSAAVYNRVGLLAHHYLRGPSGESSGCVSLKHYDRFLQAYLRGEIQRLVVVPGRSDSLPSIVNRAFGGNG